MTCQNILPLLSAWIDGETDEAETRAIQAHLNECPACARALREFQKLSNLLQRTESEALPPRFRIGLHAKLRMRDHRQFPYYTLVGANKTWTIGAASHPRLRDRSEGVLTYAEYVGHSAAQVEKVRYIAVPDFLIGD